MCFSFIVVSFCVECFRVNHVVFVLFSGDMAPKTKQIAKRDVNTRHADEESRNELLGGSNEIHNVRIDPDA